MHRRPDGRLIVSATDLVGFLACGHLTQLDRAAVAGLIRKPDRSEDPEVELLQRRGGQHEQRYVDRLQADGRVITDLTTDKDLPYEEQAARTIEAMKRGDDVIFQATVFDGRWVGHPDFLLGVPGASGLGDYHYEVSDTKLAHSAKASALIQICSYVDQIERIQDMLPERVHVVTSGAEIVAHSFRTAEMMAYYRRAKTRFESEVDDAIHGERTWPIPREESYPDPVDHCGVCRWYPDYCRVQWRDDDALKLVAGITRNQRQELRVRNINSRGALATAELPFDPPVKGSSIESFSRIKAQARLQVASDGLEVPVHELLEPDKDAAGARVADRGLSALPEPAPGDLFFDIEGDPFAFWQGLEYLFGVWEGSSGEGLWDQGSYRGLWALNREEEKQQFEQVMDLFIERWKQYPDMHIYHYAPYEPTALKRLAGRHATREEELDQLLRGRVFVDLYRVVRQGVRVGAERYSIKNLEPLYGYTREIGLRDAGSSIVEFEKILEIGDPGDEIKEQIRLYNRDDCISTERLRDWLEARRVDAAGTWGELPRPTLGELEISEGLSERLRAVHELEDRLTASITKVEKDQTEADKQTWLIAHLLDWHRREDKSTWWRYYDLMSKTDDELVEEAEPIGGLVIVDRFDPGGRSRSFHHRYRFPPQEHKIETGYDVDDPQLEGKNKRTGSVVAIDEVAGTIDIRRAKAWDGPHPKSIVPLNVIDAKDQREALLRLGNWVAENGIDSELPEWRAARDLLRRRPPRLRGGNGGTLIRSTETGTEAARRLAPSLDGTTLAIQGPPGSGKTYTGARMILDLVGAGRRVGITSNSHKVICNLLEEVLEAARDSHVTLRVIQKGKEDEALAHPWVRRVEANGLVADALNAGEVDFAAGTPWLWAHPDMADTVEALFVDEAGQVSLANVVAVSGAARNLILLGDPQQLDQPTQGVHPEGAGVSALGHFLGTEETVSDKRGVFLEKTWRMHPRITRYTSDLFYESRLKSVDGLELQQVLGEGEFVGSGLRWAPVRHTGNTNESVEEADRVAEIWKSLIGGQWTDWKGQSRPLGPDDIVIVSPFNAHRLLIQKRLPDARVGTVDKFQGQEAAVSIYTMATSRAEDAPRGLGFLYSLNRLNVATSRARALTIVVASPSLLDAIPRSPQQLRMANGLSSFVEVALDLR